MVIRPTPEHVGQVFDTGRRELACVTVVRTCRFAGVREVTFSDSSDILHLTISNQKVGDVQDLHARKFYHINFFLFLESLLLLPFSPTMDTWLPAQSEHIFLNLR